MEVYLTGDLCRIGNNYYNSKDIRALQNKETAAASAEKAAAGEKTPNVDRVEFSEEALASVKPFGTFVREMTEEEKALFAPKYSTEFTNGNVSEAARLLSEKMNENDHRMKFQLFAGMSEKQIADHCGKIGREIDEAYAAGDITDQEYADLNKGLETYTEAIASKAERHAASWEVIKERYSERMRKMMNGTYVPETRSIEEIGKEIKDQVTEFVKNFCSVNRSLLTDMINKVRAGAELFPAGTVQHYTRTNTAGFFKNGYKPFVPIDPRCP